MNRTKASLTVLVLLALGLALASGGGTWPIIGPSKATAATYVYEKDDGSVPLPVLAAINTLNRRGILATSFEEDTVDGSGDTPEPYKVPLAAARESGLPALVATNGPKVVKVVKDPKTEEQVLEAVP